MATARRQRHNSAVVILTFTALMWMLYSYESQAMSKVSPSNGASKSETATAGDLVYDRVAVPLDDKSKAGAQPANEAQSDVLSSHRSEKLDRYMQSVAAENGVLLEDSREGNDGDSTPTTDTTDESMVSSARSEEASGIDEPVLLLASHGRLVWYDALSDAHRVLHEGRGVYYGSFPGEGRGDHGTVWVVSRPNPYHKVSNDALLHLDAGSGTVLKMHKLPSSFTHDAVRTVDGNHVYVAGTRSGTIFVYTFPGMELLRELRSFTAKEHINTLAPTTRGTLWVMLHGRGSSTMVEIDTFSGMRMRTLTDVGHGAHGLVRWDGGMGAGAEEDGTEHFLVLDSYRSALVTIAIPPDAGNEAAQRADRRVLWTHPGGEVPQMLKGLAVVGGVAYFGVSDRANREQRARVACTLVAYDLALDKVRWMRSPESTGTVGLLNVVSVPYAARDSTYRALAALSPGERAVASALLAAAPDAAAPDAAADDIFNKTLASEQEKGDIAPSADDGDGDGAKPLASEQERVDAAPSADNGDGDGVKPLASEQERDDAAPSADDADGSKGELCALGTEYLGVVERADASGHSYGQMHAPYYKLPMRFDVQRLKSEVQWLSRSFNWTLRPDVRNYFVLLVNQRGERENQKTAGPFAPVAGRLESAHTRYMRRVIDAFGCVVGRARLMMLPAGQTLKSHKDRRTQISAKTRRPSAMAGYWGRRYRVHVPIVTDPSVMFRAAGTELHLAAGGAYVFDNTFTHSVVNPSSTDRVHLIFDTVGTASFFSLFERSLPVGKRTSGAVAGRASPLTLSPANIAAATAADAKLRPVEFSSWLHANSAL